MEAMAPPQVPTIGTVIKIIRRRKISLIVPFATVLTIAVCVALLLPPQYRSTATILIEEQEIPTDFVTATVTSFAEQRLQQINQRIMSATRLLEIIDQFNLYHQMREKRTTEEVIDQMRKDVKLRQISAELMDRRTGRPTVATIAFSLTYEGKDDPSTIQKVVNVLVSFFLKENLAVRERQTAETSKFLEVEMDRVQKDLTIVESRLADFKEQHINELPELLDLNIQQLGNTEQGIDRLGEQLRSIKEREGYLEVQLANVNPFLENSDRQQLNILEVELATLRSHFSDAHPDVKKTAAAVDALRNKIDSNGTNLLVDPDTPDNPAFITLSSQLAGVKSEKLSIKNQLKELRETKTKYETRIEATPRVEQQYRELVNEQINLRAKHGDLTQKHMEAQVAHGLEKEQKGERFTLIDPPRTPEKPFKPNRIAIVIIGCILGIGAGVCIAALKEFSDPCVRNVEMLNMRTGLPVLGDVPVINTTYDRQRRRIKRITALGIFIIVMIGAVVAFNYFVIDLNVFWARLSRRLMM